MASGPLPTGLALVIGAIAAVHLVSPAGAARQTTLSPQRLALARAVEGSFRAIERKSGLVYAARRRGLPAAMRRSIRARETYRVVFVNFDQQIGAPRRFGYRLVIDGRRVRFRGASVRGDLRAFHVAALRVGRHRVRLTVVDLATRRSRLAYSGQVLVTGGGPVYVTVSTCGAGARCTVLLRQSGRILFGRR